MRHGISGRKLGRTSSHRQALFANLATSLIKHGQIKTTLPKAKELRRVVDPLITLGKKGELSARRRAAQTITEPEVVKYLFETVAPGMKNRQGGYTRVLRAGFRHGDNAEMAVVQLSDLPEKSFENDETTASSQTTKTKAKEVSSTKTNTSRNASDGKETTSKNKSSEKS